MGDQDGKYQWKRARKERLRQTNNTQLLLNATYPDSGNLKGECSDVSIEAPFEPRVLWSNLMLDLDFKLCQIKTCSKTDIR